MREQMPKSPFFESFPAEVRGQNILFQGAGDVALTPLTPHSRACECLKTYFRERFETRHSPCDVSFWTAPHHAVTVAFPALDRHVSFAALLICAGQR